MYIDGGTINLFETKNEKNENETHQPQPGNTLWLGPQIRKKKIMSLRNRLSQQKFRNQKSLET
jgi:hypothetical protein